MKSLKLKIHPGEKVKIYCAAILVNSERLESARDVKPDHLGYITCIFEDTSDSRSLLWDIQNYKEFM